MKSILSMTVILAIILSCSVKETPEADDSPKLILITLDGLRWQELFTGADSALVSNSDFVDDTASLEERFWRDSPEERRKALMPFFWSTIQSEGVILGNRQYGNNVNTTNTMLFSYPGYNEILTGFADDEQITSNNKMNNPNTTVLEFINNQDNFKGKVVAFGSWDVFPYIINEERSGIPVNAGFEPVKDPNEVEAVINSMQEQLPQPWGTVRNDAITHQYMMETLKKSAPHVVYISYGETDDFAHDGAYDHYLDAAYRTDQMIGKLWSFIQSSEQYRQNTTILITTDHGRGHDPIDSWRGHGNDVVGAGNIWIAAIGEGIIAKGEVTDEGQLYQNQVARTAANILGLEYDQPKAGGVIEEILE